MHKGRSKITFFLKSMCFLTQRSSTPNDESTSDYALAIAALQAFDAPTTVKHTSGLMVYMIWFRQHGQLQYRHNLFKKNLLYHLHSKT